MDRLPHPRAITLSMASRIFVGATNVSLIAGTITRFPLVVNYIFLGISYIFFL